MSTQTEPRSNGENFDDQPMSAGLTSCVRSELLCFVTDKSGLLPLDDLVKICTDFYKDDEIYASRKLLENTGRRIPRRQGANTRGATLKDIVKALLDPERSLPVFYAIDLSRLPPTDVTHCDVLAILSELQ